MKNTVIKYFSTISISIVIGMFLGALSLNSLISYRIDEYHKNITYLESVIEEKDIKLEKLEESINNRRFILKTIEVVLVYNGDDEEDEIDKVTLEKNIKAKYSNLIGKEVKTIDIDLVEEVIHKRIMKIEDNEYQLMVKKIVLTDVLKLWIEVI